MAWFVLIVSGMFEAGWAISLKQTEGFTRLVPSIVFVVTLAVSMGGLGWALRELPVGTAYAVWAGFGAITTAAIGMIWLGEPATVGRLVSIVLIVTGIIGLRLFTGEPAA